MTLLEELITDTELLKLSVIPKADLTVRTHFACERLEEILDRMLQSEGKDR